MTKAFAFFDRDKNGFLSVKELKEVFENYDDLVSMFEFNVFDELLEQVDKDQDGKVNHQEFLAMMCQEMTNLDA